jgi:general secretion pathway protein D
MDSASPETVERAKLAQDAQDAQHAQRVRRVRRARRWARGRVMALGALGACALLASGRGTAQAQLAKPAASATPSSAPGVAGVAGASPSGSAKKAIADTATLPQFRDEVEFSPQPPGAKVQFSLEDADLPELVKVMGQLTGRRFIFGGKLRTIKATIYSPQKVTVAEAYQAFLSILETNGLTVIPHGQFLKIVETPGVVTQATPIVGPGEAVAAEDRYVTRLHRLQHVTADEVANVLGHFKSRDGDITVYSPGNLLILTDTGTNLKRMMTIVEQLDVAGIGDQLWVEPIRYAGAQEIALKLNEIFDVSKGAPAAAGGSAGGAGRAPGSQAADARVTKIIAEERTNAILVIGTEKAYLRVLELIKRLDVPMTGEGEIHVLPLQHADAEELAKTLSDLTGGRAGAVPAAKQPGQPSAAVFEGSIRVTADKSTNSLLITSSLRDYASLRNVIDRLDQARRQVFIEAVIMEVSSDHTQSFGVSFHGGDTTSAGGSSGSVVLGGSNALGSALWPTMDASSMQGLALGIRSQDVLTLAGVGTSVPAFGIVLQAVATSSDTNVLSTPHIMATDNVPAEISVGENVPLQSSLLGSAATTGAAATSGLGAFSGLAGLGTSISRQNIGTKIKLTPHINDSNEVRLEVDEEISEMGAGSSLTPRIAQRTAKTQVIVQDQQTIVIGGLVRDFASSTETKIPVLGDIPIIGALFKQTQHSNQKRNLLLILTPYVIRDPADLRAAFERKMQERQEFLDRYFVFAGDSKEWKPYVDYTRTRGLVEEIRQAYLVEDEKALLDARARPKATPPHEPSAPLGAMAPTPVAGGGFVEASVAVPTLPTPVAAARPAPAEASAPARAPSVLKAPVTMSRAVSITN